MMIISINLILKLVQMEKLVLHWPMTMRLVPGHTFTVFGDMLMIQGIVLTHYIFSSAANQILFNESVLSPM